jgi:hypothetical protein
VRIAVVSYDEVKMADLSEYIGMDWAQLACKLGWIHSMCKIVIEL